MYLTTSTTSCSSTNCSKEILQYFHETGLVIYLDRNQDLIEVQESWPYLSDATPWPYELSRVKNEFSLVGLTACQYENG